MYHVIYITYFPGYCRPDIALHGTVGDNTTAPEQENTVVPEEPQGLKEWYADVVLSSIALAREKTSHFGIVYFS